MRVEIMNALLCSNAEAHDTGAPLQHPMPISQIDEFEWVGASMATYKAISWTRIETGMMLEIFVEIALAKPWADK